MSHALHTVGKNIIESPGYIGDHEDDAAVCYQAAKELEQLRDIFISDIVYSALRTCYKQGWYEPEEYDTLKAAMDYASQYFDARKKESK